MTGPSDSGSSPAQGVPSVEYRLAPAYGLRVLGIGCIGFAVVVVAAFVLSGAGMDLVPVDVLLWVAGLIFVAVAAFGGWMLLDRRPRLRLDGDGVLNRTGRDVGVRTFGWKDVHDVTRTRDTSGTVLVVSLPEGRTSRIHLAVLEGSPDRLEAEIRNQANHALGYRPL